MRSSMYCISIFRISSSVRISVHELRAYHYWDDLMHSVLLYRSHSGRQNQIQLLIIYRKWRILSSSTCPLRECFEEHFEIVLWIWWYQCIQLIYLSDSYIRISIRCSWFWSHCGVKCFRHQRSRTQNIVFNSSTGLLILVDFDIFRQKYSITINDAEFCIPDRVLSYTIFPWSIFIIYQMMIQWNCNKIQDFSMS